MSKRFDDWEQVDCNQCGNYWTDKCDGVKSGDKKVCNSFIAQRSVAIPEQLKECQEEIKSMKHKNEILTALVCFALLGIILLWIAFAGV